MPEEGKKVHLLFRVNNAAGQSCHWLAKRNFDREPLTLGKETCDADLSGTQSLTER